MTCDVPFKRKLEGDSNPLCDFHWWGLSIPMNTQGIHLCFQSAIRVQGTASSVFFILLNVCCITPFLSCLCCKNVKCYWFFPKSIQFAKFLVSKCAHFSDTRSWVWLTGFTIVLVEEQACCIIFSGLICSCITKIIFCHVPRFSTFEVGAFRKKKHPKWDNLFGLPLWQNCPFGIWRSCVMIWITNGPSLCGLLDCITALLVPVRFFLCPVHVIFSCTERFH